MTNIVFGVISIIMAFAWIGQTEMNLVDVLNPNAFLFSVYYNLPSWLSSGLNFAVLFFAGLNSMVRIILKLIAFTSNYWTLIISSFFVAYRFLFSMPHCTIWLRIYLLPKNHVYGGLYVLLFVSLWDLLMFSVYHRLDFIISKYFIILTPFKYFKYSWVITELSSGINMSPPKPYQVVTFCLLSDGCMS